MVFSFVQNFFLSYHTYYFKIFDWNARNCCLKCVDEHFLWICTILLLFVSAQGKSWYQAARYVIAIILVLYTSYPWCIHVNSLLENCISEAHIINKTVSGNLRVHYLNGQFWSQSFIKTERTNYSCLANIVLFIF